MKKLCIALFLSVLLVFAFATSVFAANWFDFGGELELVGSLGAGPADDDVFSYGFADVGLTIVPLGMTFGLKANLDTENPYYLLDPWDQGQWAYVRTGKNFYSKSGYRLDKEMYHIAFGVQPSGTAKFGVLGAITIDLLGQPTEEDINAVGAVEAGFFIHIKKLVVEIDGKYQDWIIDGNEWTTWRAEASVGWEVAKNLEVFGRYQLFNYADDQLRFWSAGLSFAF